VKHKKVIISGGPGFGKTAIIDELESRQFICMPEVSRSIIKEQLVLGGDVLPWKNLEAFSNCLFDKRVIQFEDAPMHQWVFFDRAIHDILAYMDRINLKVPNEFLSKVSGCLYHSDVFIVPPWKEIFRNDDERQEDFETACEIHEYILNTYFKFGYNVIELPKVSVVERADFIINHIGISKN
jgi:predicted ATPase